MPRVASPPTVLHDLDGPDTCDMCGTPGLKTELVRDPFIYGAGDAGVELVLKQASRARVASFGCASWHKANLEAAQRTMSQVARDEMACAKRTFGTFPH